MPLENKTYILLKDLPNAKAGTIISPNLDALPKGWYGFIDARSQLVKFAAYDVENMPDWFKPKEPKEFTESDLREFVYKYKYEDAKKIDIWIADFLEEKRKQQTL